MIKILQSLSIVSLALMLCLNMAGQNKEIKLAPSKLSQKALKEDSDTDKKMEKDGAENETDGMLEAMKQEVEMTKDPKLGYVPRERLIKAMDYTQHLINTRAALTGINWVERGPIDVGGRTRAIMVDPNDTTHKSVFAAGVGGGLWKTTDITSSNPDWKPINDMFADLAITTIACDSAHPHTMYFGTGEGWYNNDAIMGNGIWKSTDGGATWAQLSATNNNSDFSYIQRLQVDPVHGYVYAATSSGIWRSKDGGSTWKVVLNSASGAAIDPACDIQINSHHILYAAMGLPYYAGDGIYKSATGDSGTWVKKNTGSNGFPTSGFDRIAIACAPSNANYVYAMTQSTTNALGGIYKSVNGGNTWTSLTKPSDSDPSIGSDITRGQAWYDLICAVDPNDTAKVIVGGVDLFKSVNGGKTWAQLSHWYGGYGHQYVHADQHAIVFQPGNSSVIYFGNDGGIFRTTNGGTNINDRDSNYRVTQFYACDINPTKGSNQMLAGAQDNGSLRFANAGLNAGNQVTGGDGAFCHISQTNPANQFTSYVYSNFYYSNDTGNTFSTGVSNNNGAFVNASDYDSKKDILYSGNLPGYYLRWDSASFGGATYIDSVPAFNGRTVTAVAVSPTVKNRVFFGTRGGKVVRLDSANSVHFTATDLTSGSMPTTAYVSCIAINPLNVNYMLVTYSNYGVTTVWLTKNGGTTWTAVQGNLPDMPVRWALFAPGTTGHALLATELGVWTTDSLSGASTLWGTSNTGLANVRTDMLKYRSSDKVVIAATHGRGLYSTNSFGAPKASFVANDSVLCDTGTVTFTNTSTGAVSYKWYFGDGGTSTGVNPSHRYATCGSNYAVKLVVTNASGVKDSLTHSSYIKVRCHSGTLVASAGGNKTSCSGSSVTIGTATKTGVAYNWSPATGLSSTTISNPTASPSVTTVYTLTAYSSTTCSFDTSHVTVSPKVTPSVTISANPGTTICSGTSITFTAVPTNGGSTPSYQWKKNGSNVGANSNTFTTSTLSSSDKILCVLTSTANCATPTTATSKTDTTKVNTNPTVITGGNKTDCSGKNITLGSASMTGYNYSWSPNTALSTSTTGNPVANPTATTKYTLTVTNKTTGCSNKDSMTLTINPLPVVSAGGNKTICNGNSTAIGATSTTGVTYVWSPTTSLTSSTASNPTASPTTTTKYRVTATTTSTGCTNTDSMTLTVNPTGTPSVSISASALKVCAGTPAITFTATPTNGGSTPSYQWKKNGSNVGKNSTTFKDTLLSNNDIITCVLTSSSTCVSPSTATSKADTIKVNPLPTVSAGGNKSICNGNSTSIGSTSTTGETYTWSPATHLSSSTSSNPTANPTTTTKYTITATTTATGCTNTDTMTLTVNPTGSPSVSISTPSFKVCAGTASITFTATPTNGGSTPSYQWKKNGSNVGTNSTTFKDTVLNNNDIITCVLTSSASCISPSTATSKADTIKVNPLPIVGAGGNKSICNGNSTTIGSASTAGETYVWSPATHLSSSTSSNPTANPTTTTAYKITATVTSTGCTNTDSMTLTVNPTVTPSISISAASTKVCAGTPSITFTATPNNGGSTPSYQWKKNGSNVGANSATYKDTLLNNNDIITCVLTSTASCASPTTATSNSDTIIINPLPTANAGGNATICSGSVDTLGTASLTGNSYSWSPSTGLSSSTVSRPVCSVTTTTTYYLTVSNSSTGCVNKDSMTLTVKPTLTPTVSIGTASTKVCAGTTSVSFTATVTNGGSTPVYIWKKNGSTTGTNSDSYKDSIPSNNDIITCTLTSNATCASPATITSNVDTITINPLPVSNAGGNATICSGKTDTLGVAATSGYTYSWSPSTGLSSTTVSRPVSSATSTTTYYLTVTNTATTCVNKDSIILTIDPHVALSGISGPSTLTLGNSGTYMASNKSATGYHWVVKGGTINSGQGTDTVKITWGSAGYDSVKVWANCSDTVSMSVKVSTGTQSLMVDNVNLMIYPNPNTGQFTLELNTVENDAAVKIEVINVLGQTVFATETYPTSNTLNRIINLNPAVGGIYFVRLTQGGMSSVRRITVQQ